VYWKIILAYFIEGFAEARLRRKELENLNVTTIVVEQFYEPSQPLQYPKFVGISQCLLGKL
jgi:hypothetical protein